MITLEARKRVIVTEASRNRLAQPGWGEDDMNWRSLRQRRRQVEKKGSRQPLKTCAIRMTRVRSAFALITIVEINTITKIIPKYANLGSFFGLCRLNV